MQVEHKITAVIADMIYCHPGFHPQTQDGIHGSVLSYLLFVFNIKHLFHHPDDEDSQKLGVGQPPQQAPDVQCGFPGKLQVQIT